MAANVETMFYAGRTAPWHGLGMMVEEAPTSQEALKLAALSVAVVAAMQAPVTAEVSGLVSLAAGTSAAFLIGVDVTITAVAIAAAVGGIGTLNMLREYRLEEKRDGMAVLLLK